MDDFLQSYKDILRKKTIRTFNASDSRYKEEELQTVLSAVVLLLRRHSSNGQLCCDNNANNLEVTDVDSWGFVTAVKCKKCQQPMETTCHDAKSTYERINDKSKLNPGDHICWHRPFAYWHHAVIEMQENHILMRRKIIHYHSSCCTCTCPIVKEHNMPGDDDCLNTLYRVNYQDCYDADYSILRAQKLLNMTGYNLLIRNCEHFSHWCKTGIASSYQVGICWRLFIKCILMFSLRIIALGIILGLFVYAHEDAEDTVKDHQSLDDLESYLTAAYISVYTVVFIIYLLIKSGSRLHPVRMRRYDIENLCSCSDQCSDCCLCTACCRRPYHLACGLFCRIVIRELLAAGATLCIVLFEEPITNQAYMAHKPPADRAAILVVYSMLAHTGGFLVGILLGRCVEGYCCEWCPTT